jgi:DNA replication licensing factor MCM4
VLEQPFLNVDCSHIKIFDPELYRQLISYPQEVIPTFDMGVNELFFEKYSEDELEHQIQVFVYTCLVFILYIYQSEACFNIFFLHHKVRTYNVDQTKNLRSLNPQGERG